MGDRVPMNQSWWPRRGLERSSQGVGIEDTFSFFLVELRRGETMGQSEGRLTAENLRSSGRVLRSRHVNCRGKSRQAYRYQSVSLNESNGVEQLFEHRPTSTLRREVSIIADAEFCLANGALALRPWFSFEIHEENRKSPILEGRDLSWSLDHASCCTLRVWPRICACQNSKCNQSARTRIRDGESQPSALHVSGCDSPFWHVTWLLPRQWPIRAWAERVVISRSIPPRRDVIFRTQPAVVVSCCGDLVMAQEAHLRLGFAVVTVTHLLTSLSAESFCLLSGPWPQLKSRNTLSWTENVALCAVAYWLVPLAGTKQLQLYWQWSYKSLQIMMFVVPLALAWL